MLKQITASLAVTAAIATAAAAADLPVRTAPPPMLAPLPVFTWTGFYVGVNVGGAFGGVDRQNSYFFPLGSIPGSGGTNGTLTTTGGRGGGDGFTGGGQIGYNYQFGGSNIVVGIEADAQYLGLRGYAAARGTNYTFSPLSPFGVPALGLAFADPAATVVQNGRNGEDFFGTVRGRIGYAFGRFLPYATGGLAYGGGDTEVGFAAGGGVEYAFSNNVSIKVEGLYVDLGDGRRNIGTTTYDVDNNVLTLPDRKRDTDFGVARVGLNYRF